MNPGHYHVDVFAGPKERFVRGFTLLPDENGAWIVYDEIGLAGPPQALSAPLPLADALRLALAKLYTIVEKPLRPVWGGAPLDLLGYRRPTFVEAFRAIVLRIPFTETVGVDGLPVK